VWQGIQAQLCIDQQFPSKVILSRYQKTLWRDQQVPSKVITCRNKKSELKGGTADITIRERLQAPRSSSSVKAFKNGRITAHNASSSSSKETAWNK
jgi:hypothetical protein